MFSKQLSETYKLSFTNICLITSTCIVDIEINFVATPALTFTQLL